jgi:DNA-directed RNA polymerase specialized sigma24 family protein
VCGDKVSLIKRFNAAIRRHQEAIAKLKAERAEEVRQLRAEGLSVREVGDRVGLHWTRVQPMLREGKKKQA